MADKKYYYATGRRKTATVTLRLFEGSGVSTINGKPVEEYYPVQIIQLKLVKPFAIAELDAGNFHFTANARGGGVTGWIEAIDLAISKAITQIDPELRKPLKKAGLLKRDPRMVERKKPGHMKARKSEQFSKR
jgi:small subunit ribosomal protein S9